MEWTPLIPQSGGRGGRRDVTYRAVLVFHTHRSRVVEVDLVDDLVAAVADHPFDLPRQVTDEVELMRRHFDDLTARFLFHPPPREVLRDQLR